MTAPSTVHSQNTPVHEPNCSGGAGERTGSPTAPTSSTGRARWEWADHGNCIGQPDLFYHREDEPKATRRSKEKRAKLLCDSCPVQTVCRDHAMNNRELYGVWGGLTENERHRLAGRCRSG